MAKLYRALIAGTIISMAAGNTFAGDTTFETTFNYDKTAPVEVNYENFQETAQAACRAEARRTVRRELRAKSDFKNDCQQELMTKVVKATKIDVFIAFHNAQKTKLG